MPEPSRFSSPASTNFLRKLSIELVLINGYSSLLSSKSRLGDFVFSSTNCLIRVLGVSDRSLVIPGWPFGSMSAIALSVATGPRCH